MLLHGFALGEGFREGHSGRGQAMCRRWCASKACRCWNKCAITLGEPVDARAPLRKIRQPLLPEC